MVSVFGKKINVFVRTFIFLCLLFFSLQVFAQSNSVSSASLSNRKTSVKYLKLSQQYVSDKDWNQADKTAALGLQYDDSVADLWYIRALSSVSLSGSKFDSLNYIEKAFADCDWVDYNNNAARVLYADILSKIGQSEKALSILDAEPALSSADAELIRLRIFYNSGTNESIKNARTKADSSRLSFPDDERFAEVFFQYEYKISGGRTSANAKIADEFIKQFASRSDSSELEIYLALFSTGEAQSRLLKSFNAKNLQSPLFIVPALRRKIINQNSAVDYFLKIAENGIDLSEAEKIISAITEKSCVQKLARYFNAFNGKFFIDTDGDLIFNQTIYYERGRPAKIEYDFNQDDKIDWMCECDFGNPISVFVENEGLFVKYNSWPFIEKVVYKVPESESDVCFEFVNDAFSWSPFSIEINSVMRKKFGFDFFVVSAQKDFKIISEEEIMNAASKFQFPSAERKGAIIKGNILEGKPVSARYFVNDKMYAQTHFEDGIPAYRTVDGDGDGIFETTEFYGFDSEKKQDYISDADEEQISKNLFGASFSLSGFYIKMIQIDNNGDTIPDFTEEYTSGYGRISSWDTDGDGNWDIRYEKFPADENQKTREESMFKKPFSDEIVVVSFVDGQPDFVQSGELKLDVTKVDGKSFYWIGEVGTEEDLKIAETGVNKNGKQNACMVFDGREENEENKKRFFAVKIAENIFCEIIDLPEANSENSDSANSE